MRIVIIILLWDFTTPDLLNPTLYKHLEKGCGPQGAAAVQLQLTHLEFRPLCLSACPWFFLGLYRSFRRRLVLGCLVSSERSLQFPFSLDSK